MSYAARELNKLPVTEAVHKIKQHVRHHQELRKDLVLGPTVSPPPEGPNFVLHKDIDGKIPLEVDVSLDRNIAEVLVQTKRNFWTGKHELGAFVTLTPSFPLNPKIRKGFDSVVILMLALVGGYSGHVVSKACSMMFTGGYRFFGHIVGMFLLALFVVVIMGTLVLINLWTEWRDAETCTNLFHKGKLVQLDEDEAAEVFKRLSWCHRNLEVYETTWLNRILEKIWPKLRDMLTKMVSKTLEQNHILQKIKQKTAGYLELSVLKVNIGHHPPQVSGIRVLGDRSRDVIIDAEITFDDEVDIGAEIEVRIHKFKPFTLSLGLRKLFLRLMLRIVVSPVSSDLPLADSVSLYLMERPSLNWTFEGLGRILNLRFLQNMVEDLIASLLLYPKSIQVKLIREYLTSEPLDTEDPIILVDLDNGV